MSSKAEEKRRRRVGIVGFGRLGEYSSRAHTTKSTLSLEYPAQLDRSLSLRYTGDRSGGRLRGGVRVEQISGQDARSSTSAPGPLRSQKCGLDDP